MIYHLVSPVITDVKAATQSLKWAVEEMEKRYKYCAIPCEILLLSTKRHLMSKECRKLL